MNQAELTDRFDRVAAVVAQIIDDAGQDPDVILTVQRTDFKLRALTVPGANPLYFVAHLGDVLLTSPDSDAEIAREREAVNAMSAAAMLATATSRKRSVRVMVGLRSIGGPRGVQGTSRYVE